MNSKSSNNSYKTQKISQHSQSSKPEKFKAKANESKERSSLSKKETCTKDNIENKNLKPNFGGFLKSDFEKTPKDLEAEHSKENSDKLGGSELLALNKEQYSDDIPNLNNMQDMLFDIQNFPLSLEELTDSIESKLENDEKLQISIKNLAKTIKRRDNIFFKIAEKHKELEDAIWENIQKGKIIKDFHQLARMSLESDISKSGVLISGQFQAGKFQDKENNKESQNIIGDNKTKLQAEIENLKLEINQLKGQLKESHQETDCISKKNKDLTSQLESTLRDISDLRYKFSNEKKSAVSVLNDSKVTDLKSFWKKLGLSELSDPRSSLLSTLFDINDTNSKTFEDIWEAVWFVSNRISGKKTDSNFGIDQKKDQGFWFNSLSEMEFKPNVLESTHKEKIFDNPKIGIKSITESNENQLFFGKTQMTDFLSSWLDEFSNKWGELRDIENLFKKHISELAEIISKKLSKSSNDDSSVSEDDEQIGIIYCWRQNKKKDQKTPLNLEKCFEKQFNENDEIKLYKKFIQLFECHNLLPNLKAKFAKFLKSKYIYSKLILSIKENDSDYQKNLEVLKKVLVNSQNINQKDISGSLDLQIQPKWVESQMLKWSLENLWVTTDFLLQNFSFEFEKKSSNVMKIFVALIWTDRRTQYRQFWSNMEILHDILFKDLSDCKLVDKTVDISIVKNSNQNRLIHKTLN